MTTASLIELLNHSKKVKRLTNISKPSTTKWFSIYQELLRETDFLPKSSGIRERLYYVEHNLSEYVKCHMCDEKAYWNERGQNKYTYNKYCPSCAKKSPEYVKKHEQSMMEKHGVKHNWNHGHLRDNALINAVLKHGSPDEIENVDNIKSVSQLQCVKDKSKQTMMEKYGVEAIWKVRALREQHLRELVLKHGTPDEIEMIDNIKCFLQLKYAKDKSTITKIQRYNNATFVNPTKIKASHRIQSFANIKLWFDASEYSLLTTEDDYVNSDYRLLRYQHECGSIRESHWPYIRCTNCYPYNKSIGEQEVFEYCKSLSDNVESNNRQVIEPLELDIYLPDHKLAIEYDGIFWHSSDCVDNESEDYHLNKTNGCLVNGVQLLHIFENEWLDPVKQEIWKSIIRNQLGQSDRLYARKCEIKPVDNATKSQFLQENHLQGDCVSSVSIGLYYESELVSLMTFGKSRFNKEYDWELLRFCNKKNLSVIGGASRLLKRFRDDHVGSIISYADMRRSSGNLYKQLGFELSHVSKPNYWYFQDGSYQLESRIKYQKHKLVSILENFDDSLTESENMYNNGYRKIYDCGNMVWILS